MSANFTATEWLEKEFNEKGKLTSVDFFQAKQIEKIHFKQIADFWNRDYIPKQIFQEYLSDVFRKNLSENINEKKNS